MKITAGSSWRPAADGKLFGWGKLVTAIRGGVPRNWNQIKAGRDARPMTKKRRCRCARRAPPQKLYPLHIGDIPAFVKTHASVKKISPKLSTRSSPR